MNQFQFKQSMERILAFMATPKTPEDEKHLEQYLKALFEQISRWDPFMFDQVTKELARSLTAGRKPAIRDFESIYSKMRDALPKTEFKCVPCNTTGWIYIEAMDQNTGEISKFSKPCPECRQNHPLKTAPLRQGWVECEGVTKQQPDAQTQRFIDRLLNIKSDSPEAAMQEMTARWNNGAFKLDRLSDFIKRMTIPHPIEEVRKNELVLAMIEAPARETSAVRPPDGVVGAGSAGLLIPPASGLFPDGSRLDDPDIPF